MSAMPQALRLSRLGGGGLMSSFCALGISAFRLEAAAAPAAYESALPKAWASGPRGVSTKVEQPERPQPSLHVSVEPLSGPHEGVSVITLCRPAARNAIGRQMLRELAEAISNLRQERTTRCVVLRSSVQGIFCAGADLKERAAMTHVEAAEFVSSLRRTITDLQALPMPTVAAVDGAALGGGAELALACDLRVAGPEAVFAFPEAQLGIIPGAGGTQRLPRLIGISRAKELIFTCRRVGVAEALEMGLADHGAAEGGEAYTKALELARDICRSAPLSLRMAKEAITQGMNVDMASALKVEEACYSQLLNSKDRSEGLKAFAEKRPPSYTGE